MTVFSYKFHANSAWNGTWWANTRNRDGKGAVGWLITKHNYVNCEKKKKLLLLVLHCEFSLMKCSQCQGVVPFYTERKNTYFCSDFFFVYYILIHCSFQPTILSWSYYILIQQATSKQLIWRSTSDQKFVMKIGSIWSNTIGLFCWWYSLPH